MLKSESAFFGLKIYAEIKRLKTFGVKRRNIQAPMDYRRLRHARYNFYRAIFENSKTGKTTIQELPPEFLHNYIVGSLYENNKKIKRGRLDKFQVRISPSKILTAKIKDNPGFRLNPRDQNIKKNLDWIKEQYALFVPYAGYLVIIPCHVIGAAFYFTSTTMRKRIFDSKIESLYFKVGREGDGVPYVELKPGVPTTLAPFVYFYATDDFARKRWHAIRNSMYAERGPMSGSPGFSEYAPLKIELPPLFRRFFTKSVAKSLQ